MLPAPTQPSPFDAQQIEGQFLKPLAQRWMRRIEAARKSREPWARRAQECLNFYRCMAESIWDGNKGKGIDPLWKGAPPKFKMVVSKAFELVAIFGPSLFYDVPHRRVSPRAMPETIEATVNMLLAPYFAQQQQMMQQAQMAAQQAMAAGMAPPPPPPPMPPHPLQTMVQQDQQAFQIKKTCADLMQDWLNYTPDEQPSGGLAHQMQLATTDALVTGRGVLFTRPHQKPNGRIVTGSYREDPMRLLVDPDHKTYAEAKWIALQRTEPIRDVEQRFGLTPGSLKNKATLESAWTNGSEPPDGLTSSGSDKVDKDLFMYWEIWSMRGCGLDPEEENVDSALASHLDQVAGRYVYLAVAPNVDYPLNLPPELFNGPVPAEDQVVADWLSWPIPTWKDGRFPCEVLDFYHDPESAWPIAPLTPGMPELKFMTLAISHMANRVFKSSRDFIGIAGAGFDETKDKIVNGDDMTILRVPQSQGSIQNTVGFLQQPPMNLDLWKVLEMTSEKFEERTGLNELAYGGNSGGTQSRTAADAANKREATLIRPQYMQKTVESWASRVAGLEAMCAKTFIQGKDVAPLLGQAGATLWQQFVQSQDFDSVAAEFDYRVDAGSMRRPNKEQLVANVGQFMQVAFQPILGFAQATGNTELINAVIRLWGDSVDMDVSEVMLPPMPPPQPPAPPEQAPPQAAA